MDLASTELRRLAPNDWHVFRRIRLAALTDAPHAFGATLQTARQRSERDWRDLLTRRAQFVATTAGVAVGTVGALDEGPDKRLISMWVDPTARGSGISDLLVRTVIDHAAAHGCPQIRLEIIGANIAAENLYTRHGFRRTGHQGIVAPDDPRTEFEMARSAE